MHPAELRWLRHEAGALPVSARLLTDAHWGPVQSLLTWKQSSFSEPCPSRITCPFWRLTACVWHSRSFPIDGKKTLHIPHTTNTSPKWVSLFPEPLPTNSSTGICLSFFSPWFLLHFCFVDTDLTHPSCSQNSSHACTFWSQEDVACSPRGFNLEGAFNSRLIRLQKAQIYLSRLPKKIK